MSFFHSWSTAIICRMSVGSSSGAIFAVHMSLLMAWNAAAAFTVALTYAEPSILPRKRSTRVRQSYFL